MVKTLPYSYHHIWKVAYPILISLIMEQLIGMTDTAFLGRVGEVELGASAIAGVYCLAIFVAGMGFGIGSQIIIARRNGEGNYRETGNIFYHGVYFLLGLAVVIIALSELFSPWILHRMVSSQEIADAAMEYVRWRLVGFIFAFVTVMFRAFYVGTTQTKTLTLNSIVMVLANVLFNWILVFGNLGFPALGIAGSAIGSTLAELVSLIFFIVYTVRRTDCGKYGLDRKINFSWGKLRGILSISVWTMIQNFLSVSTWFIFFLCVEHLGERALAESNVVRSISGFIWVFASAFSSTCSSLVSNLIGEGHQDSATRLIRRIIKLAYAPVLVLLVLFCVFPKTVISIYTDIPGIIDGAVPSLRVLCAAYLFTTPALICFNAISGTGNTRTAFGLEILVLVIYTAFCIFIINGLKPPVWVAWLTEVIYGAAMLTAPRSHQAVFPDLLLQDMVYRELRPAAPHCRDQSAEILHGGLRPGPGVPRRQTCLTHAVHKEREPFHVVRAQVLQQRMETGAVVRMSQMAELMQDDIVAHRLRQTDKIEVQVYVAAG